MAYPRSSDDVVALAVLDLRSCNVDRGVRKGLQYQRATHQAPSRQFGEVLGLAAFKCCCFLVSCSAPDLTRASVDMAGWLFGWLH